MQAGFSVCSINITSLVENMLWVELPFQRQNSPSSLSGPLRFSDHHVFSNDLPNGGRNPAVSSAMRHPSRKNGVQIPYTKMAKTGIFCTAQLSPGYRPGLRGSGESTDMGNPASLIGRQAFLAFMVCNLSWFSNSPSAYGTRQYTCL